MARSWRWPTASAHLRHRAALGASAKVTSWTSAIENGVTATVKQAETDFGRIDILVNNAGVGPLAPAESFPTEAWDRTLAINLKGYFLVARAAAPGMLARGSGRIVNIASQAASIGIAGHTPYCASKAGILGMTRCMALEWGPRGVTVNAISPTVVETELGLKSWSGEIGAKARAAIPRAASPNRGRSPRRRCIWRAQAPR